MDFEKYVPCSDTSSPFMKPLSLSSRLVENAPVADVEDLEKSRTDDLDVAVDLREVYFLITHFLSAGPCHRTYELLQSELLEHQLLPRRYHAWYSRVGMPSGYENDNDHSFPLPYPKLVERYPHIGKDHLVKLLKQLMLGEALPSRGLTNGRSPKAADVSTLLGTGSYSLLSYLLSAKDNRDRAKNEVNSFPTHMRWPHIHADQVRGLLLREIGGFSRHHRAPPIRAACYAIAKPSTMVQKMQNIKKTRGHRNAVYCAIFDRSGRYVITGSDDRLVKIWSMETAYCLASCRGHEGDITDLAVSSNNALVASSSNDCIIRVWHLPNGYPVSVLRGHTGAVTAIVFSPRPGCANLLSSSDDGTCKIWDARVSQRSLRTYVPRPADAVSGKINGASSSSVPQSHQIFCCAFNANGTVFVTGSSDTFARVWNACKPGKDSDQPINEIDVLSGHGNDVNYVQFSGCAVASRFYLMDSLKEDSIPSSRNSWFSHDSIVTCSRDGSAIIWTPRSRRSHGKVGRWVRAYHLKVPSPPLAPQPLRGGPRQRVLPTPRGVNMIVWSLDNRFVLAAIMDCRICVWNAADGSLVHCLTGHTQSTYILDVHPFNPRIAMSAGYDGRTIVWDIWEGLPIRTYDISRFKLVDGKFSPDGTSIILSDDVGQLYILSTGQGESQEDAKYDQFFLGDYRPLIQDTEGTVIDQETQLPPNQRNLQDLLCDSGMEPYPEPYQSMYQRRRLGALGLEWKPGSLKLAVGPDFSVDPSYQLLPLPDLDVWVDPLPGFMDWEPEIEVHSDDTDSEYNAIEEYSSGEERASLVSNSSSNLECSAGDSEFENAHKHDVRKSKRKKEKILIPASSGRRVRRRHLDVCDSDSFGTNVNRKSKAGQKSSKRASTSKARRLKRAAARNGHSMFSKIDGETSDGSVDDLSETEFQPQDSSNESEDGHIVSEDKVKSHEILEPTMISVSRPRLVIKFSLKNSNKLALPESMSRDAKSQVDIVGSSSNTSHEVRDTNCGVEEVQKKKQLEKVETPPYVAEEYNCNSNIRWGGVKVRSSKHGVSSPCLEVCDFKNIVNESAPLNGDFDFNGTPEVVNGLAEVQHHASTVDYKPAMLDRVRNLKSKEHSRSDDDSKDIAGISYLTNELPEIKQKPPPKLRIVSKSLLRHPKMPLQMKIEPLQKGQFKSMRDSTSDLVLEPDSAVSDHSGGAGEFDAQPPETSTSAFDDDSNAYLEKNYDVVSQRWQPYMGRSNLEDGCEMRASTSSGVHAELTVRPTHPKGKRDAESNGHRSITIKNDNSRNRSQLPCEDWGSSSRITVRLRSAQSNRSSNHYCNTGLGDEQQSYQTTKEGSWLLLSMHDEGSRYIPQKGDEVVYMRQGHKEYIEGVHSNEPGPWTSMREDIRAAEYCKVVDLQYSTVPSGDSCCKMTLQFSDCSSGLFGNSFKLTIPEITSFPDFLVEKSRFDAAIHRNWSQRDKCKVWWRNETDNNGSWWDGRVVSMQPKSQDFPDSPWERFTIKYRSDTSDIQLHSPWELFDSDMHWEQPHIDYDTKLKLLSALSKLEQAGNKSKDRYGTRSLNEASGKSNYKNKFPVPLSLELIHLRLNNNYYRSLEAVEHDIEVTLNNAKMYFEETNAEILPKIRRLSELFSRTLSSL